VIRLVGVVGPTASGKTALGVELALQFNGEIVSCDSTAVYIGLDIGTDKPGVLERRGVPHHLIDVADPSEVYSAARYATDAAEVIREIASRGRLPIIVGGTGFYFRALTRGLFPGPGRDDTIRTRLERIASRRGTGCLHRWLQRVDPGSAQRILSGDRKRMIRALEVYLLTGRPLTAHFADTTSPLGDVDFCTLGLTIPRALQRERVSRRVDEQFSRGVVTEVQRLIAAGVPPAAHAFSGLVYRQVIDLLNGVRNEADTRALIIEENMRYAKRQMTWFRKEPGTVWLDAGQPWDSVVGEATSRVATWLT
jgi:tRNA dimethylallyltransferase